MAIDNNEKYYDATNSWNGYNHQGKVAIYVALKEINHLLASSQLSLLPSYFIELEWLEDFSIGLIENGNNKYLSVHQVKTYADRQFSSYEEAVTELLNHIRLTPDINNAYLHVVKELEFGPSNWVSELNAIINEPKIAQELIERLDALLADTTACHDLVSQSHKRGRPEYLISKLKDCCDDRELTNENVETAITEYRTELRDIVDSFSSMTAQQSEKVKLYSYDSCEYCSLDAIEPKILEQIKVYFSIVDPYGWKVNDLPFIKQMQLFVMGKLDQYIIKRHINYGKNYDRKICFGTILEWLNSEEPSKHDSGYYVYHLKKDFIEYQQDFCKRCSKNGEDCCLCKVISCAQSVLDSDFSLTEEFLRATTPTVLGTIDLSNYARLIDKNGYFKPFFTALRDSNSDCIRKLPVSFVNDNKDLLLLTTIHPDGGDFSKESICAEIVKNDDASEILRDYDILISDEIKSDSVFEDAGKFLTDYRYDEESFHIAYCKKIRIIPMNEME